MRSHTRDDVPRQHSFSSRRRLHFVILSKTIFSTMILAACVPFYPVHYYRPDASEGKIVSAACPNVPSFILFDLNGVDVGIRAEEQVDDTVRILVTFTVPEGKIVRYLDANLEVVMPDGRIVKSELSGGDFHTVQQHAFGRGKLMGPSDPMIGGTVRREWGLYLGGLGPGPGGQDYAFKTTVPGSDAFIVRLPRLSVNGEAVEVPSIKFIKDKHTILLAPLNC